ncbi:hypothetical protein SESBI_26908 [Sesbania bispinosa]|nr:hypothetical protein SESBI_26908 [Sesbania bispinosa]
MDCQRKWEKGKGCLIWGRRWAKNWKRKGVTLKKRARTLLRRCEDHEKHKPNI